MNAFRVHAGTLPPEGRTYEIRLGADEAREQLGGGEDLRFIAPVEADLRALPSGSDLFVLGSFRSRLAVRCVRCLSPFEQVLTEEVNVVYVAAPAEGGGEVELHREDLEVEPLGREGVDLVDMVMKQILVAVDPHPVCRPECRGLCPTCGEDRNRVECGCRQGPIDPRLSVLAKWKPKA